MSLEDYGRKNERILNWLYNEGVIDDSLIEDALKKSVLNQARWDYENLITKGMFWPDHVPRPECLAYALKKANSPEKKLNKFVLTTREIIDSFIEKYNKENLPSILKEELLNPKPIPERYIDAH